MSSKFKIGDKVILGRHDAVMYSHQHPCGVANWDLAMEKYVGKIATLNHQFPLDLNWGYVWGVDIDGGVYAWHEKNMLPYMTIITGFQVGDPMIVKRVVPKGAACVKCRDFNDYAEPNMPDGSFKCYSCRRN